MECAIIKNCQFRGININCKQTKSCFVVDTDQIKKMILKDFKRSKPINELNLVLKYKLNDLDARIILHDLVNDNKIIKINSTDYKLII